MRIALACLLLPASLHAAALQGFVLDFESGRALARTTVTLTPLPSSGATAGETTRTESNGAFFLNATPGSYLLTLKRPGFAVFRYGARCGTCPGSPLALSNDQPTQVTIRLHRLGALTGTIIDENQIGIPGIPVHIYKATRPLEFAGEAKTDDRGSFRVGELLPGSYIVRTVATEAPDGVSYLATFYPEGTEMTYVRSVPIELDRTAANVDFPPAPGKLYKIRGRLVLPAPGSGDSIELISDSGRQGAHVNQQGDFTFDHVAPGTYELFAEAKAASGHYAAWQTVLVERDSDLMVPMTVCPPVRVTVLDEQHKRVRREDVKVMMRRKDLDRNGPEIPVVEGLNDLAPGDWGIRMITSADFYPVDVRIAGVATQRRSHDSAEDWVLGTIPIGAAMPPQSIPISITLSSRVASLKGRVFDKPNEPVAYAPILLETANLEPPDPPIQREARSGPDGSFQFGGLPPGRYRLVASYDLDWSDRAGVDAARPVEVSITAGENANQDISLFQKR